MTANAARTPARRRPATYVDTAQSLGCRLVKVFDAQVRPGQNRSSAGVALAIGSCLSRITRRHATSPSSSRMRFRSVPPRRCGRSSTAPAPGGRLLLGRVQRGADRRVAVPVGADAQQRIQYTQVKDAKLGALGATYCKLGEGDVQVQKFITRLRGRLHRVRHARVGKGLAACPGRAGGDPAGFDHEVKSWLRMAPRRTVKSTADR